MSGQNLHHSVECGIPAIAEGFDKARARLTGLSRERPHVPGASNHTQCIGHFVSIAIGSHLVQIGLDAPWRVQDISKVEYLEAWRQLFRSHFQSPFSRFAFAMSLACVVFVPPHRTTVSSMTV